jgi:hypothetical protein
VTVPADRSVHIDNHPPVIDHKLLEKNHKRGRIVIEIHQIVVCWHIQGLIHFISEGAAKENLAKVRKLVEHQIYEEKAADDWLLESLARLHDQMHVHYLFKVLDKARISQLEEKIEVG